MKSKLTLSIDKELVKFARGQALRNGKSVSGIFSEFLRSRKSQIESRAVPKVSTMSGTLKQYKIDDSKSAIRNSYARNHPD